MALVKREEVALFALVALLAVLVFRFAVARLRGLAAGGGGFGGALPGGVGGLRSLLLAGIVCSPLALSGGLLLFGIVGSALTLGGSLLLAGGVGGLFTLGFRGALTAFLGGGLAASAFLLGFAGVVRLG
jgi:hypothetical protein